MESSAPAADGSIAARDLKRLLDAEGGVLVLDVREPEEFADWHIRGAHNLPLARVLADPSRVPPAREVVAVCAHGIRSARARDALRAAGRAARNLAGGMIAWNSVYDVALLSAARGKIAQVRRVGKGCVGYVVAFGRNAVAIDVTIDTDAYVEAAGSVDARIVAVADTHAHADHVSGGRRLAREAGARYVAPSEAGRADETLEPGGRLVVGDQSLDVVATPGHTPGHLSFLVGDVVLTGDTLFVEAVGRPDLGQDVRANGAVLWHTLHEKLFELPRDVRVLPGHFGPGVAPAPRLPVVATLGEIRTALPELSLGKDDFVAWLRAHTGPKPSNFDLIRRINRGEADIRDLADLRELEAGPNRCAA